MLELKKKCFDFSWISECRGALMGFAALWVVLFHSPELSFAFLRFKPLFVGLDLIKGRGNAGVDIFLLLSGLGLYYSLEKTEALRNFIKDVF
ncbi:MAG: hypothetical protein K6F09_04875 [Clostridiales bacterium]|nr:hypothetical protein [Clostridiales bacterium]